MNVIKKGNLTYKYEFYWRDDFDVNIYDSENKLIPYPEHNNLNTWADKEIFLLQLKTAQQIFTKQHKFREYSKSKYKNCLICNKKNIITGLFTVNGIKWNNGMAHYINKHNIKPSEEFIDYIYRFNNNLTDKPHVIGKIKAQEVIRHNKKMLRLDRNQILIMDALMWHGGKKFYKDCNNNNIYRYSEHYGLLDFTNNGLEKIIIFANTNKVDPIDDDIFLPRHNVESYDYEYIFHTHPITGGRPGGRVKCGILYEFPSVSDIFHFINHYNTGRTCGSLVITAEGLYMIKKYIDDDLNIKINEDDLYNEMLKVLWDSQKIAIEKYGTDFATYKFYSAIAQDRTYINMINKVINKYQIHIDYYPRVKDKKGRWYINTIYLSVYVTEVKKIK